VKADSRHHRLRVKVDRDGLDGQARLLGAESG
jgi:hypothetical protein